MTARDRPVINPTSTPVPGLQQMRRKLLSVVGRGDLTYGPEPGPEMLGPIYRFVPGKGPMLQTLWKRHGLVIAAGAACILVNNKGIGPLWLTGLALLVAGMLMRWAMTRAQRPPHDEAVPLTLDVPVNGRWMARNGPATKVPSHTHNLAQTYAIDLARRPAPDPVWLWPMARRPKSYPSFGEVLLAPQTAGW